ncbi:hypothetical protein HCN44_004413 [Aphidius gifuensis]|uniref:C2H2-type domain-containing protein n=1 Tax=Aphidius gifuensis TaxID=684658 RepID=A0A834XZ58_APHGI|nr:zinc finger protein 675-like [Aphidius gifuensis]KAF7994941.1 hypothetical protein HCN44_004413 [Aphidius gifuensis]
MVSNENSNDFICSICGDKFNNENQYYGHLRIHSGEVVWNCEKCNNPKIIFTSQSKLIAHEKLYHNLTRQFKCPKCDLSFERASQLNYHNRSFHLYEKNQICSICKKGFFRKTDLNTHMNIHLKINQLMCEYCGNKFNHISNLIRHIKTHSGMKQYPCTICEKRFTQLSSLTRHKKIHTTVTLSNEKINNKLSRRKHYCKTCGESFHLIFHLRQHEQLHAQKIGDFSCKNCSQVFQCHLDLQDHSCRIIDKNMNEDVIEYDITLLNNENKLSLEMNDVNSSVSPILRDIEHKLSNIEIDSSCDESINISDLLGPYNYDEIEFPNTSVIHLEKVDNVEQIGCNLCHDNSASKESCDKCLHIEKNQLYIEVCEADYLKNLELNINNDKEFCSDKNQHGNEKIQENIELILQNKIINCSSSSSSSSSSTTPPISHDNQWIEQPSDNKFESSMYKNFHVNNIIINQNCDKKSFENYIHSSVCDDNEPMIRLVQNEDGAQFFELIRDSAHYNQIEKNDIITNNNVIINESEVKINIKSQKQKISDNKKLKFRDQKFECTVCNKYFTTMSNLKQHTGTHFADQQKFKCQKCDVSFAWKSTLNKHIASNHRPDGPQKFVCEICPKVYNTFSQVNEHVKRDHLKERNHICPECGKTFFKKFDLKSHIRIHTNERPYICQSCGKGFYHQSHIIRHERIHSGERPYSCDICQKSFTQPGSLKAHKQTHQDTEKLDILDYQLDEDDPTILTTV